MNIWKILGIEETSDIAAIKTAYAAKAKEWHPEEHPEEFKRLQQAYKAAVRLAKWTQGVVIQAEPFPEKQVREESGTEAEEAVREEMPEKAEEEAVREEMPEKAAGEAVREEMPEKAEEEAVREEMPEKAAGEAVREEVPEKAEEEAVREEMPEKAEEENPQKESLQKEDKGQQEFFDYEEVEAVDLKNQFFGEFFSIAWNPYLMNNLICWEYILKRSSYDRLLSDSGFRSNFVRTASGLKGWKRKTLLFFERWLQSRPADAEEKKETNLLCWKLKKMNLFDNYILSAQRCATNEQKKYHQIILAHMARYGRETSLDREENVECYLSFYLPYAAGNQSRLQGMYQMSGNGRAFYCAVLTMLPAMLIMMIYANASIITHPQEQFVEKARNEIVQERAEGKETGAERLEELRKYAGTLDQEDRDTYVELLRRYAEENFQDNQPVLDVVNAFISEIEVMTDAAADAQETCKVTYLYKGSVFNEQEVPKGYPIREMEFGPEPRGRWDFDYSTVIEEDTTIEWIGESKRE